MSRSASTSVPRLIGKRLDSPRMAIFGVGIGAGISQLGNTIMSAAPQKHASEAGGLQGTASNLGMSLGTALIGAVLLTGLNSALVDTIQSDPRISQKVKNEVSSATELVPVITEKFELAGYRPRGIRLQGKVTEVSQDTHARVSPVEVLARLKPVYDGGVQTGGNSSALVDAAAAAVVASGAYARGRAAKPLARLVGAAAVGVPPEIMGIGPAPAIRLLLERTGLTLDQIGRLEINEAQGAQTLAVARELGLDISRLNVNGGAIALGHPLAATGVRLTLTLARELQRSGLKYGISSACVGGGQGIALLIENLNA